MPTVIDVRRQQAEQTKAMCYCLMPEMVDLIKEMRAVGIDVHWSNLRVRPLNGNNGESTK
jgi:hypothetical protein